MIYFLRGEIIKKLFNSVVLEVSGVGYQIFLGSKELEMVEIGKEAEFFTDLRISDDNIQIYGFLEESGLNLFKLLKSVSGVGPKTAFGILATGRVDKIIRAISIADKAFFKGISGVGPKSVLKIIVELQDKVGKLKELDLKPISTEDTEIVEALENMGYKREIVVEVVERIGKGLSEQEKIQQAIKLLS